MATDFRRTLGPWSAGALIAGGMIGTGIFFFVSDVAAPLGSAGWILTAWAVGAVLAGCGALSLAELAAAYPQTGGAVVYLHRAYGPATGFLYSWAKFLIMRPGTLGILVLAFAGFFFNTIGVASPAPWVSKSVAAGVVVLLTAINIIGVRAGAGLQNVLTAIKLAAVAALIAVGGAYALGWLATHPVAVTPAASTSPLTPLLFATALIPVMWTIGGWDETPFVAEEIDNPGRNLPLSILVGVSVVVVLYIAVNGAYLAILTPAELAGSAGRTATLAMQRALGPAAQKVLAVALMISTFGAANGYALTGGRIAFAAGRQHPTLAWLGRTHPRTKTPVRGLCLQAALTITALWCFDNPLQLLFYTGLAYWAFASITALAVLVLRWRDPDRERPFKAWGYPVVPLVFAAAAGAMAVAVGRQSPDNASATGLILLAGLVVYLITWFLARRRDSGTAHNTGDEA